MFDFGTKETDNTKTTRTLSIQFNKDVKVIDITTFQQGTDCTNLYANFSVYTSSK
jgi:hypothetical protein